MGFSAIIMSADFVGDPFESQIGFAQKLPGIFGAVSVDEEPFRKAFGGVFARFSTQMDVV